MTKYYYDDPLIAAYMCKEFGVGFNPRVFTKTMRLSSCHGIKNDGKLKEYQETRKVTLRSIIMDIHNNIEREYSLNLDSYDILKPQVGDIWKSDQHLGYVSMENKLCANGHIIEPFSDIEIIQRAGKAFIMPKKE